MKRTTILATTGAILACLVLPLSGFSAESGATLYGHNCIACHGADGSERRNLDAR